MRAVMKILSAFGIAILFLFVFVNPAGASVSLLGATVFEKEARPGEIYRGSFEIRNFGKTPAAARIYQTDYRFFYDGRNIFGEPGRDPRSNATWITVSPSQVRVDPGGRAAVKYEIRVPPVNSLVGTFWSCIMVEDIGGSTPETLASRKNKIQIGLKTVVRYAVQLVTHIQGTGTRNLKFLKAELTRSKNKPILQLDIENDGERALVPALSAEFYDTKGKLVARVKGEKLRLYPATSARMRFKLEGVPAGNYKALIVADSGDESVFGTQFPIVI
jgi:P pilus assembly chaperone PapD